MMIGQLYIEFGIGSRFPVFNDDSGLFIIRFVHTMNSDKVPSTLLHRYHLYADQEAILVCL